MKGLKAAFPLDTADEALRRAMQGQSGSQDETPIFVVGLPRSGSTLVEQILASHPQVYGAGEAHLRHAAMALVKQDNAGKVALHPVLLINCSGMQTKIREPMCHGSGTAGLV